MVPPASRHVSPPSALIHRAVPPAPMLTASHGSTRVPSRSVKAAAIGIWRGPCSALMNLAGLQVAPLSSEVRRMVLSGPQVAAADMPLKWYSRPRSLSRAGAWSLRSGGVPKHRRRLPGIGTRAQTAGQNAQFPAGFLDAAIPDGQEVAVGTRADRRIVVVRAEQGAVGTERHVHVADRPAEHRPLVRDWRFRRGGLQHIDAVQLHRRLPGRSRRHRILAADHPKTDQPVAFFRQRCRTVARPEGSRPRSSGCRRG